MCNSDVSTACLHISTPRHTHYDQKRQSYPADKHAANHGEWHSYPTTGNSRAPPPPPRLATTHTKQQATLAKPAWQHRNDAALRRIDPTCMPRCRIKYASPCTSAVVAATGANAAHAARASFVCIKAAATTPVSRRRVPPRTTSLLSNPPFRPDRCPSRDCKQQRRISAARAMAPMQYFPQAQATFVPPLVANENAYLGDIASSYLLPLPCLSI
jgi:hypothetical protein